MTLRLDRVQSGQPNIDRLITVAASRVHEFFPIKSPSPAIDPWLQSPGIPRHLQDGTVQAQDRYLLDFLVLITTYCTEPDLLILILSPQYHHHSRLPCSLLIDESPRPRAAYLSRSSRDRQGLSTGTQPLQYISAIIQLPTIPDLRLQIGGVIGRVLQFASWVSCLCQFVSVCVGLLCQVRLRVLGLGGLMLWR